MAVVGRVAGASEWLNGFERVGNEGKVALLFGEVLQE